MQGYVAVLSHYFQLWDLNYKILGCRQIKLVLRSVAHNAPLKFSVKAVYSLDILEKLVKYTRSHKNRQILACLYLMGYFGFFRLSTLVPPNLATFEQIRYVTNGDIIWRYPGAHVSISGASSTRGKWAMTHSMSDGKIILG